MKKTLLILISLIVTLIIIFIPDKFAMVADIPSLVLVLFPSCLLTLASTKEVKITVKSIDIFGNYVLKMGLIGSFGGIILILYSAKSIVEVSPSMISISLITLFYAIIIKTLILDPVKFIIEAKSEDN